MIGVLLGFEEVSCTLQSLKEGYSDETLYVSAAVGLSDLVRDLLIVYAASFRC
jgi:hypothetical protein